MSVKLKFISIGLVWYDLFPVLFYSILEFRKLPYKVVRNNAKPVPCKNGKTDLSANLEIYERERGGAASLDYFVRHHDLVRKAGLVASLQMAILGIFPTRAGGGGGPKPINPPMKPVTNVYKCVKYSHPRNKECMFINMINDLSTWLADFMYFMHSIHKCKS